MKAILSNDFFYSPNILDSIFKQTEYEIYPDKIYRENFNKELLTKITLKQDIKKYRNYIFSDFWYIPKNNQLSLCGNSLRSLVNDNAGGNSSISEMMSIEYFFRVFNAKEVLLEMEVQYWIDYKMVDFVCTIPFQGRDFRVGVSVTRAMGYPSPENFTYERGLKLLQKKLYGLIVSRRGVIKKHSFYKSILHVWCQTAHIAYLLQKAYESFDIQDYGLNIKGVVILQLTVCSEESLYTNRLPKLWLKSFKKY